MHSTDGRFLTWEFKIDLLKFEPIAKLKKKILFATIASIFAV
jgi:hypothetical protein